jgi:hypothetical protein
MNQFSQSVDDKLCRWEAARISESTGTAQRLADEVYRLVLRGQGFEDIWDELILRRLVRLFDWAPPKESVYGERVRELRTRTDRVILINNLLYLAVDGQAVEAVIEAMRKLEPISESRAAHLRSGDLSGILRERSATTSERMGKAVDVFTGLWGDEEPGWKAEAERCRSALKDREAVGCASVLLVHQTSGEGLVSPVNAALQPGTGSSQTATPASPAFESAVGRARLALVSSSCGCHVQLSEPAKRGSPYCLYG